MPCADHLSTGPFAEVRCTLAHKSCVAGGPLKGGSEVQRAAKPGPATIRALPCEPTRFEPPDGEQDRVASLDHARFDDASRLQSCTPSAGLCCAELVYRATVELDETTLTRCTHPAETRFAALHLSAGLAAPPGTVGPAAR